MSARVARRLVDSAGFPPEFVEGVFRLSIVTKLFGVGNC